jgi:hypothetical protein
MGGDELWSVEKLASDLRIRERAEAALRTMNFSHWVDLTYRKDGKELTEQGDWLKPALRRLIELLDKEACRKPEPKTLGEVFEDEERMNSVGTCGICGYQGPGPKHDCKIRLIIRSPGDS